MFESVTYPLLIKLGLKNDLNPSLGEIAFKS